MVSKCEDEQREMLRLAQTMFDTKLPPGEMMLQPFAEGSSIKKFDVHVCINSVKLTHTMAYDKTFNN